MNASRRLIAFICGVLMYIAAVMFTVMVFDMGLVELLTPVVGGRLNARIIVAFLAAGIDFGVVLYWAYLVVRVPVGHRRPLTPWCLAGVGAVWLGTTVGGVFMMTLSRSEKALQVTDVLLSPRTAPFWGPLNIAAVLAAVLVAGYFAKRRAPKRRRSSSSAPAGTGQAA